jgi:hypothetical protein
VRAAFPHAAHRPDQYQGIDDTFVQWIPRARGTILWAHGAEVRDLGGDVRILNRIITGVGETRRMERCIE